MDIYIKPVKKAVINDGKTVKVKDIAEIIADKDKKNSIENITVLQKEADKKDYLVTIMDLIKLITAKFPDVKINNLGETDVWVEFDKPKKSSKIVKFFKVFFISCVLAVGASTAIMSFHTDSQIPKIFQNYYKIFFDEQEEKPLIIQIPYSIGLALGILVFFNHFAGKKITKDPTPIEVELALYENDVKSTVVNILAKGDGGKEQ